MNSRFRKITKFFIILIFACSLLAGCQRKPTAFSEAYELYQNEQYEEALEIFESLDIYRGSDELAMECREKIAEMNADN